MTLKRTLASIFAILLVSLNATAQSKAKKDDPDLKEIRDYRLSMDIVERFVRAVKSGSTDPAAKKCFDNNPPGNAPSLDAGEKIINACPAAVADLKAAGIKPREFLIVTAALLGDVMAVGLKKAGTIKEYPATVSPENAAFVEQNYEKLQGMLAPLNGDAK